MMGVRRLGLAAVLGAAGLAGCAQGIRGTYALVKRELPDGTVQRPPDVVGVHTMTRDDRHTSVAWHDARGRVFAVTYAARYTLTESTYDETMLFLTVDDEIGGTGTLHEFGGSPVFTPVEREHGLIRFDAPQAFERDFSLEFEYQPGGFRAIAPGRFVDYWERID